MGKSTASSPASDAFDRLKRKALRRGGVLGALPLTVFAAVAAIETILQPSMANRWFSNTTNNWLALASLVTAPLVLEYSLIRSMRRLTLLRTRVTEVALPLLGPTLMLDNGLLISSSRGFLSLTLLFGPAGLVSRLPVEEALRWTRYRGTRRLETVVPGAVASPASSELEALAARLGVRVCVGLVREPKAHASSTSNVRWIGTLSVFYSFSAPNTQRLVFELEAIESFLKRLVAPFLASTGTAPPSAALDSRPASWSIGTTKAVPVEERPATVGLWRRFRRTAPSFQRFAALTLVLTTTVILGGLFLSGLASLLALIVLIVSGGLVGASAKTRKDGFAAGLILGWAGYTLGFLILIPVEAGLQGGGFVGVGVGLLAGFVGGFIIGFIEGLFGGVAGYIGARLAKRPIRL